MNRKWFLIILLFLITQTVYPFGKNKINYFSYDWQIIETDHYYIYLTDEDLFLSNQIAQSAELTFEHHSETFDYTPGAKIVLVIFRNQIDFQQNNITLDWVGEATGGFTEFIKGRVVMPYSGDTAYFEHILEHELTHAFQGLLWGDDKISIYSINDLDIPLWVIEGAAEYNSIGLDEECEMMISDAIINGELPSLIELSDLYSLEYDEYYYVYKEGQMFFYYLEQNYEEGIFAELMDSIGTYREIELVLEDVFGMTMVELNADFFDFLRKRYMPEVEILDNIELVAERLIENDTTFNMNPVIIDSNQVAFISDRLIYSSIVIYDREKERVSKIIRGGFDEDYLEFHYGERNNLSVSDDGLLCFVSRSGGSDVIHLYDFNTDDVTTIELPFRIINSPMISASGTHILFSALNDAQVYDIYLYSVASGELTQITDDAYFDNQPRWLGDDKIIFVSNRRHGSESDDLDIFIYNIITDEYETVIDSGFRDIYPSVSPDYTTLAFVKKDIHPSLLIYDIENEIIYEEIIPVGGVYSPVFDESNNILFTAYSDNSYNLFEYEPDYSRELTNAVITNAFTEYVSDELTTNEYDINLMDYRSRVSMDNLLGAFSLNTSMGLALIGVGEFSDVLGNHRIQLLMDSVVTVKERFWDYINLDLSYYYLKERADFGVRLYNYSNYFYEFNTLSTFYDMEKDYYRSWGAVFLMSYPFSTFNRIDVTTGVRGLQNIESIIVIGTNYEYTFNYQDKPFVRLSFIHDSTLSDYTGPADGVRFETLFESSFGLFKNSLSYQKLVVDYRHYFMLYPGYSFAFRAVGGKLFGKDKSLSPFYLGGFNSVRGHDIWSYNGDTMFLLNFEFRFPLIIAWQLGIPLPLNMPTIWGAVFCDFGSAADWSPDYKAFIRDENYNLIFDDLKSGIGFGLRLALMSEIKLMVDFATPYEGMGIKPLSEWTTFWQIGVEF